MGSHHSRHLLTEDEKLDIAVKTNYNFTELEQKHEIFLKNNPTGKMTRKDFITEIKQEYPKSTWGKAPERA